MHQAENGMEQYGIENVQNASCPVVDAMGGMSRGFAGFCKGECQREPACSPQNQAKAGINFWLLPGCNARCVKRGIFLGILARFHL